MKQTITKDNTLFIIHLSLSLHTYTQHIILHTSTYTFFDGMCSPT